MSDELKPCPFCGERAFASWSSDNESVNIRCVGWGIDCGGQSMWFDSEDQAVFSWNTRHIPEGYALVPVKATETMFHAAWKHRESDEYTGYISVYSAMIAAAQESK